MEREVTGLKMRLASTFWTADLADCPDLVNICSSLKWYDTPFAIINLHNPFTQDPVDGARMR